MKKAIHAIIILLLTCVNILIGQVTISGKIYAQYSFTYEIYQPINGYLNNYFVNQPVQGFTDKDSFLVKLNLKVPSFITLYFNDSTGSFLNRADALVIPGDSLFVEIDPYKRDAEWIKFEGSNAVGNNAYNVLNQLAVTKHEGTIALLNRIKQGYRGNIVATLDSISRNLLLPFVDLKNKGMLSESYFKYLDTTFRLMNYSTTILKLIGSSKEMNRIDKNWRDSIVQQLFQNLDPLNSNLSALYSITSYMNLFYKFKAYKEFHLNNIEELNTPVDTLINGKMFTIKKDLAEFLTIPNLSHREDLWAIRMLLVFTFSTGLFTVQDIDFFNNTFPNSRWSPLLASHFEMNKPLAKPKLSKTDSASIIFLSSPNEKTNGSFPWLISQIPLQGKKMVYVDVWASWCGPCIKAFQQNPMLDSLLDDLSIAKLYISIDNGGYDINWRKAIYNYALKGYHYRADKDVLESVLQMLSMKDLKELSIPQYLLLDAQGKVIEAGLPSPLAFNQLKEVLVKLSSQ